MTVNSHGLIAALLGNVDQGLHTGLNFVGTLAQKAVATGTRIVNKAAGKIPIVGEITNATNQLTHSALEDGLGAIQNGVVATTEFARNLVNGNNAKQAAYTHPYYYDDGNDDGTSSSDEDDH